MLMWAIALSHSLIDQKSACKWFIRG